MNVSFAPLLKYPRSQPLRESMEKVSASAPRPSQGPSSLARVADALASDSFSVARAAYDVLLELPPSSALRFVRDYLHDPRFEVRAYVALLCGAMGALSFGPRLLELVADPLWPVRARVAEALGRLSPPGAALALKRLTLDDAEAVAEAATEALRRLDETPVVVSRAHDRRSSLAPP